MYVTLCIFSLSICLYPYFLLKGSLVEYLKEMPLFPLHYCVLLLFHSPSALLWQSSLVGQMASEASFFFSFTLICQDFITHLFSTWCIASFGERKWLDFSMHSAMVNLGDWELCSYPGAVPRPRLPICHRSLPREKQGDRLRWTMWPLPVTEHGHAQSEDTREPPKDRSCMMITCYLWWCAGGSLVHVYNYCA